MRFLGARCRQNIRCVVIYDFLPWGRGGGVDFYPSWRWKSVLRAFISWKELGACIQFFGTFASLVVFIPLRPTITLGPAIFLTPAVGLVVAVLVVATGDTRSRNPGMSISLFCCDSQFWFRGRFGPTYPLLS